jgi:hypothetical protein
MKKLILFGLLLLAGFSFAGAGPQNWMQIAEGRYYCDWTYNGQNLYNYAIGPIGATPQQASQMSDYLYGDGTPGMLGALYDMYDYADCGPNGGTHPVEFRQSMLQYNINAAGFRSVFLQVLRNYITEYPQDRAHIQEEILYFKGLYRSCLPGIYCRSPPR